MIGIFSHPHGISLNGREWALDGVDGNVMEFESVSEALFWINCLQGEEWTEDDWAEYGVHFGEFDE